MPRIAVIEVSGDYQRAHGRLLQLQIIYLLITLIFAAADTDGS
jgi:hypothetical protein